MPVRWATKNGNWSDLTVWNDSGSLGFPTASDDIFTNTFTVNVDQSFNAITLNNSARARTIATPQMTSNNTPSPVVVSSTNIFSGQPWNMFDRNLAGTVFNSGTQGANVIKVDFGLGNTPVIDGYSIYPGTNGRGPNTWTFQGSNDDSTWTTLNSVTGQGGSTFYSIASVGNTTGYRYYRLSITLSNGSAGGEIFEIELYERFTAALAAGGSFNFNSGSISGSVTSASPLSAGATNLITVTATTGSVALTLGGAVVNPNIASTTLISHTGNCDFRLSGTTFTGGTGNTIGTARCIVKSSLGTIIITGSLNGGLVGNGFNNNDCLVSTAGNTVVLGNVNGGIGSIAGGGVCRGINQSAGNLTVIGNITSISPVASQQQAITFTGTSLSVNGNVIGGAVSEAINTTAPITVIGNVSGSATNGITTTAPVIVSGSVIATGAAAAISSTSAIFINVSGSVIASATANGISSTNASAVVNLAGNIVNVNGKQAIYCQNLFLDNTATTQARFFTFGGSDRTLYSADTFPNLPSTANVRFGTTYGPGSGNTGTLRMASPQDVRSGVLTDNTTGSAILSMESLSNEIQTSSDPFAQRLKNLTTVDIIGNLLTAFKK
jgi:hypothetical protein